MTHDKKKRKNSMQIYKVNICLALLNCKQKKHICVMTTDASWMLCSGPCHRCRKVGHRGSRLQHSEFTLLSHITIPLTSLPLASGCGLHHIHCQVKHSGLLFNTPHHSSTLKPGRFDVPVTNRAEDWSPICFHPNLSKSVSKI